MALQWSFKERIGELTIEQRDEHGEWKDYEIRLYEGNAYLIMLWENDKKNTYSMYSFFADKDHAKRCLGLAKGYTENIFNKKCEKWTRIRLNKKRCSHTKELVGMLIQAFDEFTIEIYSEE